MICSDMCIHWICISIQIITISKLHLQIPCISSHLKGTHFNLTLMQSSSIWADAWNYISTSVVAHKTHWFFFVSVLHRVKTPPPKEDLFDWLMIIGPTAISTLTCSPRWSEFPKAALIPGMIRTELISRFTRKPMKLKPEGLSMCLGLFQGSEGLYL